MWSTRAKRALRQGAAGRARVPAVSAAPKSGSGRSSAVTRSMSAGAFPPTSSRSTKLRTSTREPEFAGLAGSRVHRLCGGSGESPPGGQPFAGLGVPTVGSPEPGSGPSPGPQELSCDGGGTGQIAPLARRDGLTVRGPTVRLLIRGRRCACPEGSGSPGGVRGDSGRGTGPTVRPDRTDRTDRTDRRADGAVSGIRGHPGASRTAVRLRRTRASPGNMGLVYGVG